MSTIRPARRDNDSGAENGASTSSTRFAVGTFANPSAPASTVRMLAAQTRMEASLFLRNGEQLLLALVIPIGILIALVYLPLVSDDPDARVDGAMAAVLAVAVMASAFTGQAISVGFDRRYGALKRLGATPLPPSVIIGGKSTAVALIVAGQCLIIGLIGVALGWRPGLAAIGIGALVILIGTFAFSTLGLFLGGLLKAEIVLGLANLIWFLFVGAAGIAVGVSGLPIWVDRLLALIPAHALTTGLLEAQAGGWPLIEMALLLIWGVVGAFLANRTFSFT